MRRRQYLIAAGAALGLAGCTDAATPARSLGETASHAGIDMTVGPRATVGEIDGVGGGDLGEADDETTLLVVELSAEHTGESRTWPPWPRRGSVWLSYDGAERQTLYLKDKITANGETGPSWNAALVENTRERYMHPGASATGRVAFRIERGFDPSLTNLSAEWGEGDESKTMTWSFEG